MTFIVLHRRTSDAAIRARFDDPYPVDVTSRGPEPWVRFSPFYPHGGIPVPGTTDVSESVEGIWQGLKVFEDAGVDVGKLRNRSMKGLKRTVRRFGRCLGHRRSFDPNETELLDYLEARWRLYLPAYRWVLEQRLGDHVATLRELGRGRTVVLLDYTTNIDVEDPRRPLSHAGLIVAWLNNRWPDRRHRDTRTHLISESTRRDVL